MQVARFVTQEISFLRQHEVDSVVEIRRVEVAKKMNFEGYKKKAASEILASLNKDCLAIKVTEISSSCHDLSKHMGFEPMAEKLSLIAALTRIRKMVLLLDIVMVSYVRSHGFGFVASHSETDLNTQEVPIGIDRYGFSVS